MTGSGDVRESVVRLRGVGKQYTKYTDTPTLLGSVLRFRSKTRRSKLWALRDVDLEVHRGETVGVIGRNGAGKSTMLQLLAGVTAPTEGRVEVGGRVAPLISVGVGFHPELTGRENVYVNGTVLGLARRQIDELLDGIVDFAEIEEFIDTPVKFYSSGMFVRLGFSVAVAAQPDVLLVDEVLAVGDVRFQQKCMDRMAEMREHGATVVVVSHNLTAVRGMCERVVVMQRGQTQFDGDVEDGISLYQQLLAETTDDHGIEDSPVDIPAVTVTDASGDPSGHFTSGDVAEIDVRVRFRRPVDDPIIGVQLNSANGILVYANGIDLERRVEAGEEVAVRARMPLAVATGPYVVRSAVKWGRERHDALYSLGSNIFVTGRPGIKGVADLDATLGIVDPIGAEPGAQGS